uniref:Uncharacterized protein n=1 Tax=Setaria digitata TaxID=48799 RepID=A0A915PTW6_9BILA
MAKKITRIGYEMNYSIPPSTAEQLLLLPDDSACYTPNTSAIISSALSFNPDNDNNNNNNTSNEYSTIYFPSKNAGNNIRKEKRHNTYNLTTGNIRTDGETIKSENFGLDNRMDDNSKSAYSLFETEYDIKTGANQYKFPDWTWSNQSKTEILSKGVERDKIQISPSFYHLLDMNAEPGKMDIIMSKMARKLHIPSQYQLEELQNFAPYVNVPNAERTPTTPYLPHTLTRSEYVLDEISDSAE